MTKSFAGSRMFASERTGAGVPVSAAFVAVVDPRKNWFCRYCRPLVVESCPPRRSPAKSPQANGRLTVQPLLSTSSSRLLYR